MDDPKSHARNRSRVCDDGISSMSDMTTSASVLIGKREMYALRWVAMKSRVCASTVQADDDGVSGYPGRLAEQTINQLDHSDNRAGHATHK